MSIPETGKLNRWMAAFVLVGGVFGFAHRASADIQHLDDVIISFSLAVGNDAVNGESFGFDTIRLKENNLRIHFDDTSTSASFPRNDWRIIINDSSNGGASYFRIEDSTGGKNPFTIEAGAPSHSLYVEDGGRIGLGTSTPVVELHVKDGDTPTLRLEQDGSSGFTPQTWDMAGNETNFFIRDVTNGSTLPFRIKPGAPTSALTIIDSGNVGINTWSPGEKLHVNDGQLKVNAEDTAIRASEFIQDKSGDTVLVGLQNTANASTNNECGFQLRLETSTQTRDAGRIAASFTTTTDSTRTSALKFNTNNAGGFGERLRIVGDRFALNRTSVAAGNVLQVGTTTSDGNGARLTDAGVWTVGSSRKNKEQITNLDGVKALEAVKTLQPVTYVGKQDTSGEKYVGFIAEDVPELVAMNGRDGIAAIEIVAVITKVVQEQQKTIESLTEEVKQLRAQLQAQD